VVSHADSHSSHPPRVDAWSSQANAVNLFGVTSDRKLHYRRTAPLLFRIGGLLLVPTVIDACRLFYHSSPGVRLIKNKRKLKQQSLDTKYSENSDALERNRHVYVRKGMNFLPTRVSSLASQTHAVAKLWNLAGRQARSCCLATRKRDSLNTE